MKKLFALFALPAVLVAGTITRTLNFDPADLRFSRMSESDFAVCRRTPSAPVVAAGKPLLRSFALRSSSFAFPEGFDVVELSQGFHVPDPGKPALPQVRVTVAIPAQAELRGVSVVPLETRELPGVFRIVPSQPARPVSSSEPLPFVLPDPAVYSSDELYPASNYDTPATGTATGFRLVSLSLSPIQYRALSGRLLLHTRMKLVLDYEANAVPGPALVESQVERAQAGLARLVLNPEDLSRFQPPVAELDLPGIDYLVITADRLAQEFAPYLEYKTSRGLRTELRTVEWVASNYPGRDLQEKVRNLIRDCYQHRGLSYVLLAGDSPILPSRRIRVSVGETVGDVPTDLYYGGLNFSWDSNHNNVFGEMSDSVDFYADVIVGRASVDKAAEVQNFIDKVRTFEGNPSPDYIKRSLLPSGWLWRSIGYHGRFVNDSIANITPADWTDVKLPNPRNASVVADSFNHGFSIFDPAGHGNESGVYDEGGTAIYTSSYARSQHNDRRYTIMTSLACTSGNFEAEDCVAEHGVNCQDGGCIAVMMNSRYGWGTPPSMGPSELLCIRFYDYFLIRSSFVLGDCHARSREEYAGVAQNNSLWRWCMTEFNLLGDPTVDVWTEAPTQLQVTCADAIQSGNQTLAVTVSASGSPVSNSLVCAWKAGEVFATATTNGSGTASLEIHPVTAGTLLVTATTHDRLPGSRSVTVNPGAPEPYCVFFRAGISDQGQPNPNGILEPGETGTLTLVVRNQGLAPAANATVVLRPLTSGISAPDSTDAFGTIPAQDTAAASSLTLAAAPDVFPGSSPELVALVSSEGRQWELLFSVPIGYPGRVTAEIDTTACALTLTARGSIGFDRDPSPSGRGFRFPKSDTSSLKAASFCLGNSRDYVADRFHATRTGEYDRDWRLVDSLRLHAPAWNSHELLYGSFNDAGHPAAKNVLVTQRGFGTRTPEVENAVVLVYDLVNAGSNHLSGLYAGILADFDVKATDCFHDVAFTLPEHEAAGMYNVQIRDRCCGIKLLDPVPSGFQTCIDNGRYVNPDSGLSEDMKYRILAGELGLGRSDQPFNWSVAVSTGPFELGAQGGRQRVAFAFVAAPDSEAFATACANCQSWYNANVGIAEAKSPGSEQPAAFTVRPNPFARSLEIQLGAAIGTDATVQAFDRSGRLVDLVYSGPVSAGKLHWRPDQLPAGVYLLRMVTEGKTACERVVLTR